MTTPLVKNLAEEPINWAITCVSALRTKGRRYAAPGPQLYRGAQRWEGFLGGGDLGATDQSTTLLMSESR
ncbi:hypothetical protein GCM10027053_01090 [Intrasporangium mesophilum]